MARSIVEPATARSRRTRTALLDATRAILEDDGFEALTMADVAERAQVSRRAVYLHFDSRASLVAGLFDHVAEKEDLADSVEAVWTAPDAVAALDAWARHLADYHPRVMAVDRAVQRVERADADAAEHRDRVTEEQERNCARLADWLERDGRLASGWTRATATDMLMALISTDMLERLTIDRGWSTDELAHHLSLLLRSTFSRAR